MSAVPKIERPKQVSELVLERLREDIVKGTFALGEKISETQLAITYGVTKAPVRAAYQRLLAEGLIEVRPQTGTYVFKPTIEHLRALCELRIALELEAVRLSLSRNATGFRQAVDRICDDMEAAVRENRQNDYQQLDTALHLSFFDLAQSPLLRETYEFRVSSAFAALRYRFAAVQSHAEASMGDHREICSLVAQGDLDALRSCLRTHIDNTNAYYERLLADE